MENTIIAQLVFRAANGDSLAWTDLYTQTFKEAYFIAKKIVGNEDDAVDLVHDAYLTAFEKLDNLEDKGKFQSWFNVTTANKCRDYLRKKKPMLFSEIAAEDGSLPEWEDESTYGQPEEVFGKKETSYLIAEIVDSLPEDQKLCTILYYRDQQNVAQIAEALEVSEGTVKSRLNYARKKIKTKVEALERQGIKLRSFTPAALLVWLLKTEAEAVETPASAAVAPAITTTVATATTTAGTAVVAKTVAVGAGAKAALSGVVGKVIAGVLAVSVAAGGVAIYSTSNDKKDLSDSEGGTQIIQTVPVDPAEEAYALYEDLLRTGTTENGLKITHYTYLDLDHDGVPELLVADADGSKKNMDNNCELYTFRSTNLVCCGCFGSRYENFYLVNDEYVLGWRRLGPSFYSVDEHFDVTIYHWDEAKTRNDPAISYNGGEWEYITQKEYDSYVAIPEDGEVGTGFIKTAEIITLQENTLAQPDFVEKYLNYTDAWGFYLTMPDIGNLYFSIVFEEYTYTYPMYCALFTVRDNQQMKPFGYNVKGTYIPYKDILSIQLGYDSDPIQYRFDPETYTLTQISENGLHKAHKPGDVFTLIKDEWHTATEIINLAGVLL